MRAIATIYLLLILMLATSCQKVIEVDIKPNASQLVIEGNVTTVAGTQTITVSRTVNYSDANVYPPVSGATITVTSESGIYSFKETTPGKYTNSVIRARQGQTLNMKVSLNNKEYTAVSAVPNQVPLDSLGVSLVSVGTKTYKTVSAFYRDPIDALNLYRFVMYVNGVQVKQVFAFDDNNTNGRPVNNILYQTDIILKSGDKIDVEMLCTDAQVFNYWYSLSRQGSNGPNNSATPSNPISNIQGGALGYFSAHTIQRKSIVIL